MLTPQPIMVHANPCIAHDAPLVHITIGDQQPFALRPDAATARAAQRN